MNETTPKQRLYRCIDLIQRGYICFEDEAKELSKNRFEAAAIEEALREGAGILYSDYLSMIREGQHDYEPVARRLAERFKFSTGTLESALRSGMEEISQRPTVTKQSEEVLELRSRPPSEKRKEE